jgi:hypothetical protein
MDLSQMVGRRLIGSSSLVSSQGISQTVRDETEKKSPGGGNSSHSGIGSPLLEIVMRWMSHTVMIVSRSNEKFDEDDIVTGRTRYRQVSIVNMTVNFIIILNL